MGNTAVLASIQPKWCVIIFGGLKNLEFRKTAPKLDLPFKCYVYCTQKQQRLLDIIKDGDDVYGDVFRGKPIFIKTDASGGDTEAWINGWCGKVIGEFTVDRIEEITVRGENSGFPVAFYGDLPFMSHPLDLKSGGITLSEYLKYRGKGKVYGWHIAGYKLYKEPKQLSDFACTEETIDRRIAGKTWITPRDTNRTIQRPPQSWRYVEELEE